MVVPKDKDKAKREKKVRDDKNIDEAFQPIRVDARIANTAVLMLESPEDDVLQKACESIFKFCEKSDNNRLQIHELQATMKLFKLINHADKTVQRNATMAFGVLSSNAEIRKFLRQENGACIPRMVGLLGPEYDHLINEYAALWLRNVCEDFSTKTMVVSAEGALFSLVRLLASNDADIAFNALGAIDKLVFDYQPRQMIRELKGIEAIFGLMKSEYPQIQELVFSCLCKITQDAENREVLREINGLEKLIEFLNNSQFKDMHVNCLNLLSNCLEDTQYLDMLFQNGGLSKILTYCQELSESASLPQVCSTAAKVFGKSAKKTENRKILNEQQVEKTLIYLLLSDYDEVKIAATQALAIMSESPSSRDSIRTYEGIEILIRLTNSENSKVRETATLALSNLTFSNHNNWREILAQQGIDSLVRLLKDEKDTTKSYACVALTNMASDEIIRQEVAQNIFVQSIYTALSSKSTITQEKACLTLASYCVDSAIRCEIRNSGITSIIVQLAQSNNDQVRANACWAITCSSADTQIAIEFCKFGAIEILRDLNVSAKRKSSFTEAALSKLLETNLSAKYALRNFLDPTDFIPDGFYDMGPMRPNGKFYSIDELIQMPTNDKRAIIIVYSPDEKPQSPIDTKIEVTKQKVKSSRSKERDVKASKTKKSGPDGSVKKQSIDEYKASPVNSNVEDKLMREASLLSITSYKPPIDRELGSDIDEIKEMFKTQSPKSQAINLAKYVALKFGGVIARDDVANLPYELSINELKYELKSNVVPLGKIKCGTYYHRALLFKVLADRINLKVSLHRGDYNRGWNTISLKEENANLPPKTYIIDLMHDPGRLMPTESVDASLYMRL